MSKELFAQYPTAKSFSLTQGSVVDDQGLVTEQIVAFVTTTEPLDAELHDRIERWLKARLNNDNVLLVKETAPTE